MQHGGAKRTVNNTEHSRQGSALAKMEADITKAFQGNPPGMCRRAAKPIENFEGRQIQLVSNMFPVALPRGIVYHYDVEVVPCKASRRDSIPAQKRARCGSTIVNRKVLAALASMHCNVFGDCLLAYDGRKNVYTRRRLHFPSASPDQHIFQVSRQEDGETRELFVQIKFVGEVSFDALHAMYEGEGSSDMFQQAVTAADIILRTAPTLSLVPVGRSFFSNPAPNALDLTGGLEAWPGCYTSIRLSAWKPLLNIDISTTAFYKSIPVSEFAREKLGDRCLQRPLSDRERKSLEKELSGLLISHTHRSSQRKYRIERLSEHGANRKQFEWDGLVVTVAEYFQKKYNRTLQYPYLPCVMERNGAMLPMELCRISPGQHCRQKLSETQTSKMIRSTASNPTSRFQKIAQGAEKMRLTTKPYLDEFDMSIDTTSVEVTGRVLPPPVITYTKSAPPVIPRDGVWQTNRHFNKAAKLRRWALVVHGCQVNDIESMINTLIRRASDLGMEPRRPLYVRTFPQTCSEREMLATVKASVNVDITVVVLGGLTNYSIVKMAAETSELSMRTQCVKVANVNTRFTNTFADNLLLKINAKCGGWNWRIRPEDRPDRLMRPFMIVGADVNHPAVGDNVTPSIAAVVASMDPAPAQYYAATSVQVNARGNRIEYIIDLKNMFLECLQTFHRDTGGALPEVIYFYRDGVSEGQLDAVRYYEISALRTACLEMKADYKPQMTFIVVQKRHHVRFKPKDDRQGTTSNRNVPAGTVIDSEVVHPVFVDFYLCAHQGVMGTSVPAHYHVVHDDAGHSLEEIEKLSYYLCHTYARCTRSVSIPAPAYYAHLAAARAKDYIKANESLLSEERFGTIEGFAAAQQVCEKLKGQMYFI